MNQNADPKTILLVDDLDMILTVLKLQLQYLGYRVELFTDPHEALDRFVQAPQVFDLVLSDIYMPTMTGFEMIDRIRKIRPDIPAILATGCNDKHEIDIATCRNCFLAIKPIELETLDELLKKAFTRSTHTLDIPARTTTPETISSR